MVWFLKNLYLLKEENNSLQGACLYTVYTFYPLKHLVRDFFYENCVGLTFQCMVTKASALKKAEQHYQLDLM